MSPTASATTYEDILRIVSSLLKKPQVYEYLPEILQRIVQKSASSALVYYYGDEIFDLISKGMKVKPQKLLDQNYSFKYTDLDSALKSAIKSK